MSAQTIAMNDTNSEQGLVQHLVELRARMLRAIVALIVVFLALYPFANEIYTTLAQPLLSQLPGNTSMIATEVASPFLVPFKLTMMLALLLALPYLLYQFWAFVAPGLYRHEKRLVLPLLVASVLLFYLGVLFAYFVVFPLMFAFFTSIAPQGVAVMTDIGHYLDFVLMLFIAFGAAFEVPVVTILLVYTGVVTPHSLVEKRPFVIVGCFVIGMILTPPDVFSQTLLAIPMWLLFEVGVWLSRYYVRHTPEQQSADAAVPAHRHDEPQ